MKLTTLSALVATVLSLAAVAESHSKDPYPYRKSDDDTNNDDYSNNYRSNKVLGKLLHKSTLSSEVEPSLIESGSTHGGNKGEEEEYAKIPENTETVDFSGADNHGDHSVKVQSTGPIGGPSSLQFWPVKLLSLLKQLSILYTFYYDFGRATLIHLISFSGIVSLFTFIASLYGI